MNDVALEPGEAYYIDRGWSGCAGSAWRTLSPAARDGWRHAGELRDALEAMTREAQLSREVTEKAVRSRFALHEVMRALSAADAPEDSMATEDDLLRYEGRREAVEIIRDMLGAAADVCWAPGYNGRHVAVGAGALGAPLVCHGCGGIFDAE